MFCKNCGQQIPDNIKFCSKCGAPVTPVANNFNQGQPNMGQPNQSQGLKTNLDQVVKVFAVIVAVIYAWLCISTVLGGLFTMIKSPTYLITYDYYYSASDLASAELSAFLRVLQGLSWGVLAVVMFVMFRQYETAKQKFFAQATLYAGILALFILVIRYIKYVVSSISYWTAPYGKFYFSDISWLLIGIIYCAIGFVGYLIIMAANHLQVSVAENNVSFFTVAINAIKYCFRAFIPEMKGLFGQMKTSNPQPQQYTQAPQQGQPQQYAQAPQQNVQQAQQYTQAPQQPQTEAQPTQDTQQ